MSPPDAVTAGEPAWLVCHTKPRCEKKFAALMAAEHFEHYLALVQSVRRYGRQTKRFTKPLFPGYVFACVPTELKTRIYQQDLLARALVVTDLPRFLHQLDDVKAIVASGFELTLMPLLTKGRRVKVSGGPLYGLEGYVDNPHDPRGVVISVDVLQQGLLVRVPAENLTVLP
ncbi:MAG: transcription termination/antitermination NusG family protein [Opitutales bacterium]